MNVEQARFNMIEQQIRPWRLLGQQVLDDMYVVKREEFVPPAFRTLAFADVAIPLNYGQSMLPPRLDAIILQAMNVQPDDRILEIGTGSGYSAALMAASAGQVVSMERVPELALQAQKNLDATGTENVTVVAGDGMCGWDQEQPYNTIVLSGAVHKLPKALLAQLQVGGRMLAFVGETPLLRLQRVVCAEPGVFVTTSLFETMVPFLVCEKKFQERHHFSLAADALTEERV